MTESAPIPVVDNALNCVVVSAASSAEERPDRALGASAPICVGVRLVSWEVEREPSWVAESPPMAVVESARNPVVESAASCVAERSDT